MPETVQALVDAIVNEASFDVEPAAALTWLNRKWRTMLGRARAYQQVVSFGDTVADQSFYDAPAGVKELYWLKINGVPAGRARSLDGYAYSQARLTWTDMDTEGLFFPDADENAVRGVTLIPTPTADDLPITGFAATLPPDLTLDAGGNALLVAYIDDYVEGLIAGGMATGYSRDGNEALAQTNEKRFNDDVEDLRRVVKRRFRGPGPTGIRVELPR